MRSMASDDRPGADRWLAEARRLATLAAEVARDRAIVVIDDPTGEATVVAATAAPDRVAVYVVGTAEPWTLLGRLQSAGVRQRVTPILGPAAQGVRHGPPAVGLLSLPAATAAAAGPPWADRVPPGGWIVLRGGLLDGLRDLDLSPSKWDAFPGDGRLFAARRRGSG